MIDRLIDSIHSLIFFPIRLMIDCLILSTSIPGRERDDVLNSAYWALHSLTTSTKTISHFPRKQHDYGANTEQHVQMESS
mmetsp:Transcript_25257/g.38177  ORF Transcript_25257/g.38177 Transcript_25257/m.38177 type:complete len:80 (+) Transcript_25257:494-733(+)